MKLSLVATSLVTLVVAVMVIALVAVPVIEDASRGTPYEGQNTGYDARYLFQETPTFIFSYVDGVATVQADGSTETLAISNNDIPAVVSDKIVIRPRTGGITYYKLETDEAFVVNNTTTPIVLTVTNGSYSLTRSGTETASGTMDNGAFVMSSKGQYGVFTGDPKVTADGKYYLASFFNVSSYGPFRVYEATGSTLGAAYVEPFGVSGSTVVGGYTVTATIDYQETGGNQVVGVVGDVAWTWTDGDDSGTTDHRYVIAPITFESTPTGTGDDTNSVLLSIIPVMLIIVAIMIAVRLIRDV